MPAEECFIAFQNPQSGFWSWVSTAGARTWWVGGCATASCLAEVCVESRRLDLLRRWQHVLFHYTALALTVWKPGAKQTEAAEMPGISRSLSLSLSHTHTHTNTHTDTHIHAVHTSGGTHTAYTLTGWRKQRHITEQTHFDVVQNICIAAAVWLVEAETRRSLHATSGWLFYPPNIMIK